MAVTAESFKAILALFEKQAKGQISHLDLTKNSPPSPSLFLSLLSLPFFMLDKTDVITVIS
jgi:hypothetical protein